MLSGHSKPARRHVGAGACAAQRRHRAGPRPVRVRRPGREAACGRSEVAGWNFRVPDRGRRSTPHPGAPNRAIRRCRRGPSSRRRHDRPRSPGGRLGAALREVGRDPAAAAAGIAGRRVVPAGGRPGARQREPTRQARSPSRRHTGNRHDGLADGHRLARARLLTRHDPERVAEGGRCECGRRPRGLEGHARTGRGVRLHRRRRHPHVAAVPRRLHRARPRAGPGAEPRRRRS